MALPDRPLPMEDLPPARPPAAPLGNRISDGASAADVAAALVTLWVEVDAALRPIIGQRGVVALFNRSVQLSAAAHPWLLPVRQDPNAELQCAAMASLFSRQEVATAVSGGEAQLLAFHQLLSSLIGASLTERLLRSAFGPVTGASPTQDSSS